MIAQSLLEAVTEDVFNGWNHEHLQSPTEQSSQEELLVELELLTKLLHGFNSIFLNLRSISVILTVDKNRVSRFCYTALTRAKTVCS
jgi:hypothetical protein